MSPHHESYIPASVFCFEFMKSGNCFLQFFFFAVKGEYWVHGTNTFITFKNCYECLMFLFCIFTITKHFSTFIKQKPRMSLFRANHANFTFFFMFCDMSSFNRTRNYSDP